jgi:hypothetical protein
LFARRTDGKRHEPGFELRWVDELEWSSAPFVVHSGLGSSFRALKDGYALSFGQSGGLTGLRLGPLEIAVGASVSALNAEWMDGQAGFGMFWPRTTAGLCLHLGPVSVDTLAHVEYLWSWFGDDHFVRGLGIMVSLSQPRLGPAFE